MSSNILIKIIENKKKEIALRKKSFSIEILKGNLKPSSRCFFAALNNDQSNFILECKKASPSKGLIRENFDLQEILNVYKDYASAISVLTDFSYFQGSHQYLQEVSDSVTQPVLCKDFFIERYQIYEARYFGADAILLMLSVLNDEQYIELALLAKKLNLDILTEVHDSQEMQRALKLDAKIIGINNRNLIDLTIDINTTEKLIKELSKKDRSDRIFISESGISEHHQINRLAPFVNGFLVGSSIMSKYDMRKQCKKLIYGNIKICGLTTAESAITAFDNGAIYGGLIFYAKSPRNITLEQAKLIIQSAPLQYVGVFVNESVENILYIANTLNLTIIQLHGDESSETIDRVKQVLPLCQIWKAVNIQSTFKKLVFDNKSIDKYLLDTYTNESRGGSGKIFDWSIVNNLDKDKIVLAGGLNVKNIKEAKSLATFALDINSGVEDKPGKKNVTKIKELFLELKTLNKIVKHNG